MNADQIAKISSRASDAGCFGPVLKVDQPSALPRRRKGRKPMAATSQNSYHQRDCSGDEATILKILLEQPSTLDEFPSC